MRRFYKKRTSEASINKELMELEASLDMSQEHVEKEKALVAQGEALQEDWVEKVDQKRTLSVKTRVSSECQHRVRAPSVSTELKIRLDFRYIKGRISYEQVNNAIDEIHKAITAKYKIMRLPRSAMGEPVMKKYKAFKEAETPETEVLLSNQPFSAVLGKNSENSSFLRSRIVYSSVGTNKGEVHLTQSCSSPQIGEFFFIDDDLKTYTQLKMDSTGRAILTMLRHCGRLGEVRGKKLLRYVLKQ
ncbi:Spindle and kinetochore-associated protein 1 [Acropora cervicornis]|uniref:SKA complex subunit 1 n=1 Tax=Acropora cervicornis TaxID=6130 RepID=A0AAD9Q6K0_ACRCE|nr:Spindle and kinetochore-associated protein 1 [Acropora cervicornis]